jgi:hypothetical protein
LRGALLAAFAVVSLVALLSPEVVFVGVEGPRLIYKQVLLQSICLLASVPLIMSTQQTYNLRPNARIGLESLFAWGAVALEAAIVMSALIHFQPLQKNLVALEEYADASVSVAAGKIFVDGVIGPKAYDNIIVEVEALPPHALVIRSRGGLLDAAVDIATLVKNLSLPVYVQDYCESACVIIASASPQLTASSDAVFGFHRGASIVGGDDDWSKFVSEQATDHLILILRNNGIPEDILEVAASTPPNQMHHVAAAELLERGVIARLVE